MNVQLMLGDCREVMATMPANSIDSIVTDPPAGINFMNMKFDSDRGGRRQWIAWMTEIAAECLRLLKPGGHALVWALPRTSHWTATAWEDAGFEIRDCVYHIFGSGFPKSLDIGKAIDKRGGVSVGWFGPWLRQWRAENGIAQKQISALFPSASGGLTGCVANWELGLNMPTPEQFNLICQTYGLPFASLEEAEREVIGMKRSAIGLPGMGVSEAEKRVPITAPATDAAKQWDGWGTALKPAVECWWLLRKPLSESGVAANALKWGVAGINVDASRINGEKPLRIHNGNGSGGMFDGQQGGRDSGYAQGTTTQGRWPANLLLDEWFAQVRVLRYNTPSEIKQVIQEYYYAYNELRDLRKRVPRSAEPTQEEQGAVLQPEMLCGGTVEANDGRGSSSVWQETHRGGESEDSPSEIGSSRKVSDGEKRGMEGRNASSQRIRDDLSGHLDTGGTFPLWQHDQSQRQSLYSRTSASDGAPSGKVVGVERSSTSHQRSEERQPFGEFGNIRPDDTHEGASSHSEGIMQPAPGERTVESASLRVAEDHIPTQWLKYFEPTDEYIRCGSAAALDEQSGQTSTTGKRRNPQQEYIVGRESQSSWKNNHAGAEYTDTGGASRFFYVAKASKRDRDEGLEGMEPSGARPLGISNWEGQTNGSGKTMGPSAPRKNGHPCVKPTQLMRYLVRLVTPPNGTTLDPFCGSGSTLKAAILEGFNCVGIDNEAEYLAIAQARCDHAVAKRIAEAQLQMPLLAVG